MTTKKIISYRFLLIKILYYSHGKKNIDLRLTSICPLVAAPAIFLVNFTEIYKILFTEMADLWDDNSVAKNNCKLNAKLHPPNKQKFQKKKSV